jgi:predicted GNAT superfamily acetyltransferase
VIRAFQGSGNVPYGAFEGDLLAGYVLGFLGPDPEDGVHVHSHMLAVRPERRHGGIGYALKLAQRAAALDVGVAVARWTFDPLQARNAYFNLHKLGAVADRFYREYYGEMTDELNRGDRSDRLEARWDLRPDPGPRAVVVGRPFQVLSRQGDPEAPEPSAVRSPQGEVALVEIPPEYPSLKERYAGVATAWRDPVAEALEACLGAGLVAGAFLREGTYVFARKWGDPSVEPA